MLIGIIIILAIISIAWAFWSLRHLEHDKKHTKKVTEDLSQGRVIFHRNEKEYHSSSSSASSSLR